MALKFQGFSVDRRTGARRSPPGLLSPAPDRARRDAARPRRLRRRPRLGARTRGAGHLPDRAGRHGGQGPRADLGGDDYVTKPFSLEELVARIRVDPAPHRRGRAGVQPARLRGLELDEDAHEVAGATRRRPHRDRVPPVALPDAQPAPRAHQPQILEHVWDYDFDGDGRVSNVRQLPAQEARRPPPTLIHAVRGIGYASATTDVMAFAEGAAPRGPFSPSGVGLPRRRRITYQAALVAVLPRRPGLRPRSSSQRRDSTDPGHRIPVPAATGPIQAAAPGGEPTADPAGLRPEHRAGAGRRRPSSRRRPEPCRQLELPAARRGGTPTTSTVGPARHTVSRRSLQRIRPQHSVVAIPLRAADHTFRRLLLLKAPHHRR